MNDPQNNDKLWQRAGRVRRYRRSYTERRRERVSRGGQPSSPTRSSRRRFLAPDRPPRSRSRPAPRGATSGPAAQRRKILPVRHRSRTKSPRASRTVLRDRRSRSARIWSPACWSAVSEGRPIEGRGQPGATPAASAGREVLRAGERFSTSTTRTAPAASCTAALSSSHEDAIAAIRRQLYDAKLFTGNNNANAAAKIRILTETVDLADTYAAQMGTTFLNGLPERPPGCSTTRSAPATPKAGIAKRVRSSH